MTAATLIPFSQAKRWRRRQIKLWVTPQLQMLILRTSLMTRTPWVRKESLDQIIFTYSFYNNSKNPSALSSHWYHSLLSCWTATSHSGSQPRTPGCFFACASSCCFELWQGLSNWKYPASAQRWSQLGSSACALLFISSSVCPSPWLLQRALIAASRLAIIIFGWLSLFLGFLLVVVGSAVFLLRASSD